MTCTQAKTGIKPFSHLQHPRKVIRQFTPNWFAATMGTGVLALALAQVPVAIPGLHALAEALWLFNIFLFVLFTALYAARWTLFFDEARRIFGHSTVSMFFGTIPMGLATIINGFLVFGLPRWGDGVHAGQIDRQLRQRQRQHPGAHGGGEPVRGELADHFPRTGQVAEGFVVQGGRAGHDGNPLPRRRLGPW